MGLDITAYRKLSPAPGAQLDEDGNPQEWQTHFHAHPSSINFTEENWPGRSAGIETGGVYTFADSLGFRAGSYGGYGDWRRTLARFAGWSKIEDAWDKKTGPFIELIDFADNEGVIGPVVAAKLAKDFADNQERADAFAETEEDSWWGEQYAKWREAFEMAADGGAVDFH